MDNAIFMVLGAIVAFFGYNYYLGVQNGKTQKKIEKRKSEIDKLDTPGIVNIANSIIARRSNTNK